jgi:hypothetical protein
MAELREIPHITLSGKVVEVKNHKKFKSKGCYTMLRHSGDERIFKGQNGTITHSTSKVVRSFAHKAGFGKLM